MTDLAFISLAEAASLVAARQLSPVELALTKLARIEALDAQLNAFITVTADLALRQAREAEREIMAGRYRGPMHGMPFALKDVYNTAGVLTSGHSRACIDNIPREDAFVTTRLYDSGGVLLGKLALHELAHGAPSFDAPWPPARNPWNPQHFAGGSSSGSGAAVAAGFVPLGMGTDTGGSIRNPAAMCGVAGLKPTYGLVGRSGVIPNSWSFDHCGPIASTAEDCAIALQVLAGHDPRDAGSMRCEIPDYRAELREDLRGLRIGVVRHFWEEDLIVHPEVSRVMGDALDVLKALGASLEDVRMRPLQEYTDVKIVIAETEIFCVHWPDFVSRLHDFGPNFLAQTLAGCLFDAVDYVEAQRRRSVMLAEMNSLYERYDVLITASVGPAPRGQPGNFAWTAPAIHTPFSVTGGPSMVICSGFTPEGLPLALQISGRPFADAQVLAVAHAYEKATPWRARHPDLSAAQAQRPVTPPPARSGAATDESIRRRVEERIRNVGIKLDAVQLAQLCEVAPYAFAMAQRIRGRPDRDVQPANVLRFPTK